MELNNKKMIYDPELYGEVLQFLKDHIDLVEEAEYYILTSKIFESWFIIKFDEIGYIFFCGPPRSGKTRALDVLSLLCYNSIMGGHMSRPAIYRILDKFCQEGMGCTFFLDEMQQYLSDKKTEFMAIMNCGQRRGQKAFIAVRGSDDWDVKGFETFSPKFLASTKDTHATLLSRCIVITMIKNIRKMPLRIDKDIAKKLKERIDKYVSIMYQKNFENVDKLFEEMNFRDNRLIELYVNLIKVTPPIYRKRILDYAKRTDDLIYEQDGISELAEVFDSLCWAYDNHGKGGKVSISHISEAYNDGRVEQEQLTNREIGTILNTLGFRRKCRLSNGRMGRYVSEKELNIQKQRRFRTGQQILFKTEETEDNEAKRGVMN